jgi:hypothetical protein
MCPLLDSAGKLASQPLYRRSPVLFGTGLLASLLFEVLSIGVLIWGYKRWAHIIFRTSSTIP